MSRQSTTSDGGTTSEQDTDGWAKNVWGGRQKCLPPGHGAIRWARGQRAYPGRAVPSSTDGNSRTVTEGTSTGGSNEENWSSGGGAASVDA